MPNPSWFNGLYEKPAAQPYTRPQAQPGEHEGCFVYPDQSEAMFMKAYLDAGWELESRIPAQLGVKLQFRAAARLEE